MLPETGKCFKCSAYEVAEGFIRPVESATVVEFDLWRAYADAPVDGWSIRVPYQTALELARQFRVAPPVWADDGSGLVLAPSRVDGLISFVKAFGLLGLLPVQAERIVLPSGTGTDGFRQFRKRVGFWFDDGTARQSDAGFDYMDWSEAFWSGPPRWAREWAGNPLVLLRDGKNFGLSWHWTSKESLDVLIETFFPTLGMPAEIPLPGSKSFWANYGEPLWLFITMLRSFLASVDVLSIPAPGRSDAERQSALDFLHVLAREDHASIVIDGLGYADHHHSPGLISAFAAMYLRDWKNERRVVYCETCDNIFVTADSRAKFCSERCRKTTLMRRWRKGKKQSETK